MSGLSFERTTVTSPRAIVPTFLFLGLLQTTLRFVQVRAGTKAPHVDVRCCWRPVASAVLAGQPLYVAPAVDNKPPLFELLNVAVAATDQYLLVFLVLVGLANAAVAIGLWKLCDRHGASRAGLVAGGLYLAAVPVAGGASVNVRSFAMVGILLALLLEHPVARGATLGAAGLFSQHAVFAIPVLAYAERRPLEGGRRRWLARFALSGLGVVAASFALVYAIWGAESLFGALYWTFGAAGQYTTNPTVPSVAGDADWWTLALADYAMGHLVVIVPSLAVIGLLLAADGHRRSRLSTDVPVVTATLLAVSMTAPLLVRAYPAYWLYPMPFLAMLSSAGFELLFTVGHQ